MKESSGKFEKTPKSKEQSLTKEELETLQKDEAELYPLEAVLLRESLQERSLDSLTKLKTREIFKSELERSVKMIRGETKERREGFEPMGKVSVLFIDLDHFKNVNDTLGHAAGDEVLKKVTGLMQNSTREGDLLARYGGDEFVVLLPNTDAEHAAVAAEKLRASLNTDDQLKHLGITASLGVASMDIMNATDAETLVKRADEAAYAAKHAGRNQVVIAE